MSAVIFDGKKKAEELLARVRNRVRELKKQPRLVSFYKADDIGSTLYTKIKSKKAAKVGIKFEAVAIASIDKTVQLIKQASEDRQVQAILVQHPTGGVYSNEEWQKLVLAIASEKDVDGLRDDSPFLPATVKAILYILEEAKVDLKKSKIAVIGSEGMIGSRLVKILKKEGAKVLEIDEKVKNKDRVKESDVVVSATGVPRLVKADMVKPGVVVVDVGAPKGDVDFEKVAAKSSFITPVPGGVGPMTVACLMENVLESAYHSHSV